MPQSAPRPDRIEPQTPSETPPLHEPPGRPTEEPPGFEPLQPDFDQPDIGPLEVPELP